MALNFGKDMLFTNKGLFEPTPEDNQVGQFSGNRIIPTTLPSTLTALESAMNVLELQAASAITPGSYIGVEMDIFTDVDGFLDTIDTGNTTAIYDSVNELYDNKLISVSTERSIQSSSYVLVETISNVDSLLTKGTNYVKYSIGTGGASCRYKFIYDDATSDVVDSAYIGTTWTLITYTNPNPAKEVSTVEIYLTESSTGTAYEKNNLLYKTTGTDLIVQINSQSITDGFEHYQISPFRGATSGTGSITADISFDGGTTYDTGVSVNTNHSIHNPGTSMIVKLNLNAGASSGTAEIKGWGVQLW